MEHTGQEIRLRLGHTSGLNLWAREEGGAQRVQILFKESHVMIKKNALGKYTEMNEQEKTKPRILDSDARWKV